jgi:MFS family permease
VTSSRSDTISIWKRQKRNWKIVSLRSIFHKFLQNLTIGYDSLYINQLGASPVQLGFINSIAHIGGTLISAPLGWLQDRYSLRIIFLLGSVAYLIINFLYATATNWINIIPAMVLTTVAFHVGGCLTICDVSLRDEDRSTCKGICDGTFQIPSLFAPAIAAVLIGFFGGISVEGIRPLYWIQLIGGIILYIVVATSLKEIERPPVDSSNGFIRDYQDVFQTNKYLKTWILYSLVSSFSNYMILPFTQLYAFKVKGANQYVVGLMISAGMIMQALASPFFGRVADRIGRKKVVYIIEPLYLLSILLLVFAQSPVYLIISSILGGFKLVADFIAIDPIQTELVPVKYRGRWRGIVGFLSGLIAIPAPIIGGMLWDNFGPSFLMLLPIALDLLLRIPLLMTIPERSNMYTTKM